jgi:hypothetical protein
MIDECFGQMIEKWYSMFKVSNPSYFCSFRTLLLMDLQVYKDNGTCAEMIVMAAGEGFNLSVRHGIRLAAVMTHPSGHEHTKPYILLAMRQKNVPKNPRNAEKSKDIQDLRWNTKNSGML